MRPELERRDGRWFVVLPDRGLELAPVFDHELTAAEVALKYHLGHAFFGEIPTMPHGTEYPRPNRLQPSTLVPVRTLMRSGSAIVSGGFDPIHSGHIAMIMEAAEIGSVHVILNTDEWLARKKGRPFMSYFERASVVSALQGVETVHAASDGDGTVVATLRAIAPVLLERGPVTFCNGGDRTPDTTPEQDACAELGIGLAFGVGGGKTQSSSWLLDEHKKGLSLSPP